MAQDSIGQPNDGYTRSRMISEYPLSARTLSARP